MKRAVDLRCLGCEATRYNQLCDEQDKPSCHVCNFPMEQCWWGLERPKRNAEWQTPAVVHVARDPNAPADIRVRYPMRIDAPVPAGYDRKEIRSDAAMGKFEQENKVLHHDRWYDSNGKGFDDSYRGQRGWSH